MHLKTKETNPKEKAQEIIMWSATKHYCTVLGQGMTL
jgi:hypothetical protein